MSDLVDIASCIHMRLAENSSLPERVWLREFQEQQLEAFLMRGFPTRKEEHWKYTDVSALAKCIENLAISKQIPSNKAVVKLKDMINMVFINGRFCKALSDVDLLPAEMILCSTAEALQNHEKLIQPYLTHTYNIKTYPFACLNSALMTEGLFLSIPENTKVTLPVRCVFVATEQTITSPRNIILAGANSQVMFMEDYQGEKSEYFTNTVTHIYADDNAHVHHYKIQNESQQAFHMGNLFISQKQNSLVKSFNLSLGSTLARDDIFAAIADRGADCQLHGFYYLTGENQRIDNHLHADHSAAHGSSTMMYKGILTRKSKAVFNGKVHVHKDAQHIRSQQANHNLLMSNQSEINTKPELEIYADDVKCTHGATVGQLDQESLFYLRSRGIDKEEALKLLTQAFAAEVINAIEHSAIQQYVQQQVDQHGA